MGEPPPARTDGSTGLRHEAPPPSRHSPWAHHPCLSDRGGRSTPDRWPPAPSASTGPRAPTRAAPVAEWAVATAGPPPSAVEAAQSEEAPRRQGAGVEHLARQDQVPELVVADPAVRHVLLGRLAIRLALGEVLGEEDVHALAAEPVRRRDPAQVGEPAGGQPGLLAQLSRSQLKDGAAAAVAPRALRKL